MAAAGYRRILELDILRGIAILLVMGTHVPAYPIWSTSGWLGVDLFFVLSGFLISNLLFSEYRQYGGIALKRFFLRRMLKLYPSFYVLLLVTLGYCALWRVPLTTRSVLGEILFLQNYVGAIWGHTWSLAVEEHFYLLLPVVLLVMMRANRGVTDPFRSIPLVFAGVATVCVAARCWNLVHYQTFDHRMHYELSHARFDSLFFGVLLSYLHHFRPAILSAAMGPWRMPVCLAGVAALAPSFFLPQDHPFVYTAGFTLAYFGFGILLLVSMYPAATARSAAPAKPGVAGRAIGAMGMYSYSIYLWHVPLAMVFAALDRRLNGGLNQYALHALYFATSIGVGVGTSKLIEIPVLRLRERYFPSRSLPAPLMSPVPSPQRLEMPVGAAIVIAPERAP